MCHRGAGGSIAVLLGLGGSEAVCQQACVPWAYPWFSPGLLIVLWTIPSFPIRGSQMIAMNLVHWPGHLLPSGLDTMTLRSRSCPEENHSLSSDIVWKACPEACLKRTHTHTQSSVLPWRGTPHPAAEGCTCLQEEVRSLSVHWPHVGLCWVTGLGTKTRNNNLIEASELQRSMSANFYLR